ncbi:hypothetical protein F4821DRAFT_86546 [Hypoxylon rubiginosum]|uniref:Uncharacterized protein n=1 Tax=Hypoxylon rubiginosum TaxID=110542 RepID=A0ACC0D7I0_9PEZI|nr:hypothetical protein F4821DRAFT_86546 [Hypoxylon rubiginosum]
MPQDPNLYGQRPAKRQKKEIPLSSSLDFASQLTSLLSNPSSTLPAAASATSGRPRPSKTKDDIFNVKAKRKAGSSTTTPTTDGNGSSSSNSKKDGKLQLRTPVGTEEEKQDFARARRKMEEKARLYAAMKRGDYIAKDGDTAPLVDFDRKWAEKHPEEDDDGNPNNKGGYSSSGTDNESDDDDTNNTTEMVEFKDEFGRTRRVTRTEMHQIQRRGQRAALGAAELESMAAKPIKAPSHLLYGDVIQDEAFAVDEASAGRMADLAARRDKEPTPPPDAHFDGGAEIRTKGVGFYHFSHDKDRRKQEMEDLARERDNTERARREREEKREARKRDIEERRRKIGAKRAEKLAENFLDGLAGEFGGAGALGGGDGEKGKEKEREKEVGGEKSPS